MKVIITTIFFSLMALVLFGQNIIYVQPGAMGTGLVPVNPTSLQNAINMALIDNAPSELRLVDGVYNSTPYIINYTGSDGLEIVISGSWSPDYTFQSMDPMGSILDGDFSNRVLDVNGVGAGVDTDLTLSYLSVRNGVVTDLNGAGIHIDGGNEPMASVIHLHMNNVNVVSNITNNSGDGGGIYTNCPVDIFQCMFDNNEAYNGGAIFLRYNDLSREIMNEIEQSVFVRNYNYGNQGHDIWLNKETHIIKCEFWGRDDNASSGNGSAVWVNAGGYCNIEYSRFEDIRVQYWGSAVQSFGGDFDISNSIFINNKSGILTGFGAVAYYHNNNSEVHEINITNCTFIGGESQGFGSMAGAVHFRGDSDDYMYLYNSLFWDNGSTPIFRESGNGYMFNCLSEESQSGFVEETTTLSDDPGLDENYHIGEGSVAIDAGDYIIYSGGPVDLDGGIRYLGENIDIGCFEFNAAPSGVELINPNFNENNAPGLLVGPLLATGQSGDTHIFELATGDGANDADNSSFSIDGTGILTIEESANYEVKAEYYIYVRVEDSEGGEAFQDLIIDVNDVNEVPIYSQSLMDQSGIVEEYLEFTIDVNGFSDVDEGDVLSYSASLANEDPLPTWLNFDDENLTFSGIPDSESNYEIRITATDQGGLTVAGDFTLSIDPVGLLELITEFKLYPNPVDDVINIYGDLPLGGLLQVMDTRGRLVYSEQILTSPVQINLEQLRSGQYILRIINGKWSSTKPFIKN